jgi:prolyl-tRNA editing enzyme YbaK/EbsC (Cys-tRNA(Pro) deacylase)
MIQTHLTAFTPEALLAWLQSLDLEVELIRSEQQMSTVELAAQAIGVEPEQIIKTLLFRDKRGLLARVIASGPRRIDRAKLAEIGNLDRPKMASSELVLEATGWPAGGVSPVGSIVPIPTLVDSSVMNWEYVFGGGGTELTLLKIRPADIVRLNNATITDLIE